MEGLLVGALEVTFIKRQKLKIRDKNKLLKLTMSCLKLH